MLDASITTDGVITGFVRSVNLYLQKMRINTTCWQMGEGPKLVSFLDRLTYPYINYSMYRSLYFQERRWAIPSPQRHILNIT